MANDTKEVSKTVRSQIGRRMVDATQLVIQVHGSTVYLGGVIRPMRAAGNMDMQTEMNAISTVLRSKPGIKEVIWDVSVRL